MKKTMLLGSIAIMLCAVSSGQKIPSTERIQKINNNFSFRLTAKKIDSILFQSYESSRGVLIPTLGVIPNKL